MAHTHRDRLWERAAPALRVAGAILLAAGSILLYAERVVFDARAFGAHAALSLRDPRVAGYVAERIVDEVIAKERDLTAYRPLLVGSARAIVSSDAFGAGFRRAAQEVHAAVFSESAERLALSLPDVGVLVRSALTQADPAVVARIPSDLRAGIAIETGSRVGRAVLTLARLGHRFRSNAYLAVGLGGLLFFLGIFTPRDRRGALLRGGAALASVALVVFFLPPLAGHALTFSIADGARLVVVGIWDAFAGGLRLWGLVLAGIGIVLAAAASSLASHVEVEEIARKGWARTAAARPQPTWRDRPRRDADGRRPLRGVPPDRDAARPDGDRRRPAGLRGAAGAVHARGAPDRGGRAARRGGSCRGARAGR